ncbi:Retrovirus-related Pol polyprotein from transposon TNT 1-94 [Dendrobium catenatum]|uniref:Retrovirus-related Pol polyprotein from transposon TNT 1-94 n=1 Tax=Dendrobium catenatum TaxID=906689 RepID=A0A2I0VJ09_9ASPA|nr:Retrovirus-related Pol polyprotein from transposon TNT 1-94 [Dendrobium catenatum]
MALFTPFDEGRTNEWFLNSGASSHLTADSNQLNSAEPYTGNSQVTIGNGRQLSISNTGNGLLPTPTGNLKLNHIHLVLNLSFNLMSVYQLTRDNVCTISFSSSGYQIKESRANRVLLQGSSHNGLYSIKPSKAPPSLALFSAQSVPDLCHNCLGHLHYRKLQMLTRLDPTICTSLHNKKCNTCNLAKSKRLPFTSSVFTTAITFELIHSDVWGPSSSASIHGHCYYVSFIDDHSHFCWVFPLNQKSEVIHKFIEFYYWVKCQFSKSIKIIRTDGGGEYVNHQFKQVCKSWGIIHQYTCPYTPAQNGIAERKHRHIIETTRSLLIQSQAPHELWIQALLTTIHIINIIPSSKLNNKTPYEILYNKTPTYSHPKTFGCLCYPWLRPYAKSKLSSLSTPCVFIGYAGTQKGYHCFDPITHKIYTSRHVVFNKNVFPYQTHTIPPQLPNSSTNICPLLLVPTNAMTKTPHTKPTQSSVSSPSSTQLQSFSLHSTSHSNSQSPATTSTSNPLILNPQNTNQITTQAESIINNFQNQSKHSIKTRYQTDHLKPKQILNLTHQIIHQDPTSYHQASKQKQ